MAELADRLTLAMNQRGRTGVQIADALTRAGIPITRAYVSQLRTGKQTNPTLSVLRGLADYLEVSVGWLAGEEPAPPGLYRLHGLPRAGEDLSRLSPTSLSVLKGVLDLALKADGHTPDHQPPAPATTSAAPPLSERQRQVLAGRLRRLRQAAQMSTQQAGDALDGDTVDAVENALIDPAPDEVGRLLTLYGVDDPYQRQSVLSLARAEREPEWCDEPHVPLWLAASHGLEQRAEMIRSYFPNQIPPLLQTEEYARAAVMAADPQQQDQKAITTAVDRVLARQRLLTRPGGPLVWAVIDESVLRRSLADPPTHLHQLETLISHAKQPTVTLQIVPLERPVFVPASGPFSLLRFGEPFADDIVCEHTVRHDVFCDVIATVEAYNVLFARLSVTSTTKEETVDLLHAHRERVGETLG